MSTMPQISWRRKIATMPEITRIAAMIQRSVAMVLLHFVKFRRPYAYSQVESGEESVPPNRALTTVFHPNCRGDNHDGKGAKTDIAGYEVETATTVWNRPSESELFPSVVTAISFHKPGKLVGHGMKLIERHKAAFGLDRFLVMADRAYNNSRVETFHIPVRKAGVELVIDYDQQHATLLARLHNRSEYRMIAKGLPDLDGYQRFAYKSDLWASYYGMRNLVEASNSRFKDSNQEDLGNPQETFRPRIQLELPRHGPLHQLIQPALNSHIYPETQR